MVAKHIIFAAGSDSGDPSIGFGGTHYPMMGKRPFVECHRLPPIHACHPHGDPIHSAVLRGKVPTHIFETLAPEDLALAGNILIAIVRYLIVRFHISGP